MGDKALTVSSSDSVSLVLPVPLAELRCVALSVVETLAMNTRIVAVQSKCTVYLATMCEHNI